MSSKTVDDCSICLNALAQGSPILTLSCDHKYHLQCLAMNIQANNNQCPLCRADIEQSVVQLLTNSVLTTPITIRSTEDPVDEAAVRALSDRLNAANAIANERPMITISTALEYDAQKSDEESNIYGLVTLQAPSINQSSTSTSSEISRSPIDLVCVVDQSGSMAGDKLRLLKETLVYITEQLNDLDRLAIISFNTTAYDRSHGLKRVNDQNRQTIINAINNDIHDQGGTYIGSGLRMGIDLFTRRQTKNPVGALLLLTDGQDNSPHDYSNLMSTLPEHVMCHTFGYGPDHTASLLARLAEQGNNGTFTYIDEHEAIGPAFAIALGGLFSCIAQEIQVNIEFNYQYKITNVHSKYSYEPVNLPSNKLTFKLNDLNADEKRNLVFQLHVPKFEGGQEIEINSQQTSIDDHSIGQVIVTYNEPNNNETKTTDPVSFELVRTDQPTADQLQVNYTLDIQRNRVETAREIKRAMDEHDYQRSLAILKAQTEKIQSSVSGQDRFCQSLIADLKYRYPSENAYRSAQTNTYVQHSYERGTYAPLSTVSSMMYQSPSQLLQSTRFNSLIPQQTYIPLRPPRLPRRSCPYDRPEPQQTQQEPSNTSPQPDSS